MEFTTKNIDYSSTGYFSKLICDYLEGKEELKPFYNRLPKIEEFRKQLEDKKKYSLNRGLLVDELTHQYKSAGIKDLPKNLELLKQDNSFTITTGHQLCLLGGPLYFFYKIISTAKLAFQLKSEYPEYNFIPVYWMATEDHDFEEINHVNLFNHRVEWNNEESGPVGRMKTNTLEVFINSIQEILGEKEDELIFIEQIKKWYLKSDSLADGTRRMVHDIFGEEGVLIIDGDTPNLKKEFQNVIKEELLHQSSFSKVSEMISKFPNNYKVQVNPREINLFYMKDGLRKRIIKEKDQFTIDKTNISFTEREILAELIDYPERFSPNVVLRPLYQEMILPNLGYIGGGGELAYWFELKSLFEHNQVPFPILILRNSVEIIETNVFKKLNQLSISLDSLFDSEQLMVNSFLESQSENELSLKMEEEAISNSFKDIKSKLIKVDQSLGGSVEAELSKLLKVVSGLEKKMIKAEKRKQEVTIKQIQRLRKKLFPGDSLQERHDSFIPFFLKWKKDFFRELCEQFDPLEKKFTILIEKE